MSATDDLKIILKTEFNDTKKGFDKVKEAPHKATMYALRDAARLARKTARHEAPVYRGKIYPSLSAGAGKKGKLRASIRVARKFKHADPETGYALRIFPYGIVYKYRAVQERRFGYMEAGRDAAADAMPEIYERSIRKALRL